VRAGRLLAGGVLALACVWAGAAEPSLEVHLDPERLGVDDLTQLTVTVREVEARGLSPDLGELANLEVVSGPSTETQFAWVNGVASSSVRFVYVLRPVAEGPAALGPVTVRLGDRLMSSGRLTATVVAGSLAPRRTNRRSPARGLDALDPFGSLLGRRQPREARVELRAKLSDSKVVVGEPVTVTMVLDTTMTGIERFEWMTPPTFPGCWTQRVELDDPITPEVVEIEGLRFHRYPVARFALVPLKPGSVVFPAAAARIGIRSSSVFQPLQVVDRSTAETSLEVTQRPQPPAAYAGAVGRLRYRARLEPDHIAFGESAVLTLELAGSGNLPLVEAPQVWPTCEGCETYPPEEDSRIAVDAKGIHGSRTWRTTLVPRQWGELDLAPVSLAVFDPAAGDYRNDAIGPLRLVVDPPPATPTPTPSPIDASEHGEPAVGDRQTARAAPQMNGVLPWIWVAVALLFGVVGGGLVTWWMARRRAASIPPRRPGQRPADRARELQTVLEGWWLRVRDSSRGAALESDMAKVRAQLESVRFAPGRADHSETVVDLEDRLRRLMRRA